MTTTRTTRPSRRNGPGGYGGRPRRILPPAPADPSQDELSARVDAVVYASNDGEFVVLRASQLEGAREVRLTGALSHVHVGEEIQARGQWREHPQHGWSFAVREADIAEPNTIQGIATFLESAVPGIGPTWARAIVDEFGEQTLEAIDDDPKVLRRVTTKSGRRMSAKQVRAVIESWDEVRSVRRVMVFLTSHGVTQGFATRIYRHYGERALEVLRDDPYSIVEIRGIGFRIADRIARNLSVPLESPRRIQAGIVYCLQQAEGLGHCFLTDEELCETVTGELMLDDQGLVRGQLREMVEDRRVILTPSTEETRIYLPELYFTERGLAKRLAALVSSAPRAGIVPPERPTEGEFVPNDGQWQAICNALTRRVSIITGLPGTGKTTLIKLLIEAIESQDTLRELEAPFVLCSPTGKAARRLAEASGRPAQTIHRLLRWAPHEGGFEHDQDNPLGAGFVIVDETSMVDVRLADALVKAIGGDTHLVLVGDADQLPPVGAGKVFDDLIAADVIPAVRLDEIFRQAQRSLIVRNAHNIVHGRMPFRNPNSAAEQLEVDPAELEQDYFFVQREDADEVADTVVEFAAERIPRRYGLDPLRDVLVLAPMRAGACGLGELNVRLQQRLNPDGEPVGVRDLRVGDRVIQTRNDYNIEVMNGEVGVIDSLDAEAKTVMVDFGDRTVTVPHNDLDSFLPAYAISVHRSQGSQARAVVCVVATSHYIMLTRSLVNTAITRAQDLCVCVGQHRAMKIAVDTIDSRRRNTALAEQLRAAVR